MVYIRHQEGSYGTTRSEKQEKTFPVQKEDAVGVSGSKGGGLRKAPAVERQCARSICSRDR